MDVLKLILTLYLTVGLTCPLFSAGPNKVSDHEIRLSHTESMSDQEISDLEFKVTANIQIDPYSTFDYYLLAQVYIAQLDRNPANMGKIHATSEISQHLLDLDPDSEFGYLVSAQVMEIMGYDESAKQLILEAMTQKFSPSWRSYLFLANHESVGSAEHREYVGKALMQGNDNQMVLEAQCELFIFDDDMKNAIKLAESIDDTRVHVAVATALAKKSHSTALRYFSKHRTDHGHDQNFSLAFFRLKSEAKMFNRLDVERIQKSKFNQTGRREANKIVGRFYLSRNSEKANKFFMEALRQSSLPTKDIYEIRDIYLKSKKYDDFISLLETAKISNPGVSEIYALQADMMAKYQNNYSKAISAYSDAILLDPYRSDYYTSIGLVYYKKKNYIKALSLFSEATKINPMDATAFYNRACMNSILGSSKKAIDDLAVAFELDPSLRETAIKDSDLEYIKNSKVFVD